MRRPACWDPCWRSSFPSISGSGRPWCWERFAIWRPVRWLLGHASLARLLAMPLLFAAQGGCRQASFGLRRRHFLKQNRDVVLVELLPAAGRSGGCDDLKNLFIVWRFAKQHVLYVPAGQTVLPVGVIQQQAILLYEVEPEKVHTPIEK